MSIPTSSHLAELPIAEEVIESYQSPSEFVSFDKPASCRSEDHDAFITAVGFIEMGSHIVLTPELVKAVNCLIYSQVYPSNQVQSTPAFCKASNLQTALLLKHIDDVAQTS